jgi:hypothetical protein
LCIDYKLNHIECPFFRALDFLCRTRAAQQTSCLASPTSVTVHTIRVFATILYTCTQQRMLPLDLGTTQLKKFDDAVTDEVFKGFASKQHGAQAARAATWARWRSAAMRGNDVDTRTRALRLARDRVSLHLAVCQRARARRDAAGAAGVEQRDDMKRTTTIATKAGWVPGCRKPGPRGDTPPGTQQDGNARSLTEWVRSMQLDARASSDATKCCSFIV